MFEIVIEFLKTYSLELGGGAAGFAIVETVFKPFRTLASRFRKPERIELGDETVKKLSPNRPEDGPKLTVPEFIRLRREMKEELEAELRAASEAEKQELAAKIAELESQLADPDKAFAEALERIKHLESLLERAGNEIGGDRLAQARAALDQGDLSVADEIFAEIEAREAMAVANAANAAYGRGEIAEAEIRWHDAYDHYKRAAGLSDEDTHLVAYARMTWRLHKSEEGIVAYERLAEAAKEAHGVQSAEYATQINNLAGVVRAQGRYEEAERLYREALEIGRATIGARHPSYATHLNNLALVVEAQGRYEEAEALYREALEIDRATIGERHPDYATRLINLASVVQAQGRVEEAEGLYREALEIFEATLPDDHPTITHVRDNLASLFSEKD